MNPSWIEFLQTQGAHFCPTTEELLRFEPGPQAGNCRLVPLLNAGLLQVSGPDAATFLHGQLTCDLRQVSATQSTLGAHCTAKGNVISLFRLLRLGDDYLLRLPASLLETARSALARYIVFSKAEIGNTREERVGLGLSGTTSETLLTALYGALPESPGEVLCLDNGLLCRVPGSVPRFELWLTPEAAIAAWKALAVEAQPATPDSWLAQDIRAGLAQLAPETSDEFIPQMLNLQAVGALSFNKGCYTGQEVVARMQYRGKLKRILYAAEVESLTPPAIGMSLHSPERKSVGKVLAWAPLSGGRYLLQLVASKEVAEQAPLHLDTQDGPALTLQPLPYRLDEALFERKTT